MKKITFKLLVLMSSSLIPNTSFAQNLVPNPSFEDTVACPSGFSQVYKAADWTSYNPTPDYYHSCSSSNESSVPNNLIGFQYPSGTNCNAYFGIITYFAGFNIKEYIGAELLLSLAIGQIYYVSFKISLAENNVNCATNKLGVLFSTVLYNDSIPAPITNFAHIYADSVITNTANWITISGSFIADSAYQYIILGNFFSDENTDTVLFNTMNCNSYYFIDDVCVSTDSLLCAEYSMNCDITDGLPESIKRIINIYPNPAKDFVYLNSFKRVISIKIYNMQGIVVHNEQTLQAENLHKTNASSLKPGIYFMTVETANETINQKLIIIN